MRYLNNKIAVHFNRDSFISNFHLTLAYKHLLQVIILILSTVIVSTRSIANTTYSFAEWPASKSLTQDTIISLFIDRNGLLWIATLNGVARFDGREMYEFQSSKKGEGYIEGSNIISIFEGKRGTLFVATRDSGLLYYDSSSNLFSSFRSYGEKENPHATLSAAISDNLGDIWLGYSKGQIGHLDPETHNLTFYSTISTSRIAAFAIDNAGDVYAIDINGIIFAFDKSKKQFDEFSVAPDCRTNIFDVTEFSSDKAGSLWIGTKGNGLYHFDIITNECHRIQLPFKDGFSSSRAVIHRIKHQTNEKITWIATDQGLYVIRDIDNVTHFDSNNSKLVDSEVTSITWGKDGTYWIGTYNGLHYAVPTKFVSYSTDQSVSIDSVVALDSSPDQGLWIASYNGLLRYDSLNQKHQNLPETHLGEIFTNNKIMSLQVEPRGMWVGYRASGLEFYSNSTKRVKKYNTISKPKLSSNSISTILTASNGQTYIGTHGGGLNVLSGNNSINVHSLGNDRVVMLFETSDRTMWIGTESGLRRTSILSESFDTIDITPSSYASRTAPLVWTMGESSNGDLWFGTMHHGLYYWSKKSRALNDFSGIKPVLGNNTTISTIYAIQIDNSGAVWCSTNKGLMRVDSSTKEFDVFSKQHGITDTEFDYGVSHKDDNGILYFGGTSGYTRFDPSSVTTNILPPKIYLNYLSLADNSIFHPSITPNIKTLQLSYKDYFVTFAFSVLDFIDPEKNRFRYMLENFDADWVDSGTRNTATYTNLPPGNYIFRVQGANSAGVWNREGISLDVRVLPPPWHSWWAYFAYGLASLLFFWLVKRVYDSYTIERRSIQLAHDMQAAADRADDDMQEQLELQDDLLESAHAHSVVTLGLVDDCLSVHREHLPKGLADEVFEGSAKRISALSELEGCLYYYNHGLVADLRKYTDIIFSHLVADAPVLSETITTINAVDVGLVPVDLASPLAIVIFELLENCIQHAFEDDSPANYIQVTLTVDAGNLMNSCPYRLYIGDSGIGFPDGILQAKLKTSGLAIVQSIAAKIGAKITVESTDGAQITLEFYGPQPQ